MIAVYASMKLQHLLAACHLMKIVNILCDHSLQLACLVPALPVSDVLHSVLQYHRASCHGKIYKILPD